MKAFLAKLFSFIHLTDTSGRSEISETREVSDTPIREVMDSLACPYCRSASIQKRGFRQKKRERVQLYLCLGCRKTFTLQVTKGKHYPLAIMLDAISIYNLGYSLEQTCRIVTERHQKTASSAALVDRADSLNGWIDTLKERLPQNIVSVNRGVDSPGVEPGRLGVSIQPSEPAEPTPSPVSHVNLHPSTLANWIAETEDLCRFCRMREYAIKKFSPKDMVVTATLAHRQLYRYRFHRGKCDLIIQEEYGHRKFAPLSDFLSFVPVECPHQYFQQGLRASETPLAFSKTAMIVRGKTNYATRLAAFVLQSVADHKTRHEEIQKFFLANDSVTVATEVPVYLTRDDMEHMKTQLGFELYSRVIPTTHSVIPDPLRRSSSEASPIGDPSSLDSRVRGNDNGPPATDTIKLPKLITGHIDLLQIRNGQIHILDYKPNAAKEQPIEQLTLYAMALSRLTGLRLFEFKCAWFDEKDYFEFYPLHVLHKPKSARRRKKVVTQEGVYAVNKNEKKVESVRPTCNI